MRSKLPLLWCICGLAGAAVVFSRPPSATPSSERSFEFTYTTVLKNIPAGTRHVRVWIPLASSAPSQTVRVEQIKSSVPVHPTLEGEYGNRMLYAEWNAASPGGPPPVVAITVRYHVIRRQFSRGDFAHLMRYNRDPWTTPVTLARYLQPDHLVPVDGRIRQLATANTQGRNGEIAKAHAIYDYIFHNMRYDKSGAGWGRGDALWACDAHHGNCTDFHSLFISMARAEHIPARFQIGFPLPEDQSQGMIPGYHCWAEFYVDGVGWVPVDISEAWLDPARYNYYFGAIDASRVRFSTGRDLTLQPAQAGPPVNYFVYPYVELDGRPYEGAEKAFSFHETPLKAAPAASTASRQAGGR
jgi:transglutaminase-like putative cysteine protease